LFYRPYLTLNAPVEELAGMPKLPLSIRGRLSALRPLGALVALCALTACTDPLSIALSGASVVSVVQTGKTISDHAMSAATGMDCSLRHSISGESWCQPEINDTPDPATDLVCYRSIANVTCYNYDNPHETASRRTQ
jgi:hypothetical protein